MRKKVQEARGIGNEDVADEPPELPLEDEAGGEGQGGVDGAAGIDQTQDVDHRVANGDPEHQIGNPPILVPVTETLKIPAQIFHKQASLALIGCFPYLT